MATVAKTIVDRDFSFARIFELTLATIRSNPIVTLAIALLFGTTPGMLAGYLVARAMDDAANSGSGIIGALFIFSLFLNLAVSCVTQAFQTRATVAQAEGRQAGFAESVRAGTAIFLPLIVLAIMVSVAITFGYALLVVPGLFLGAIWSVAVPAMVEERRGIFSSLRRSHALTSGARWKIFGLTVALLVLSLAVMVAVEMASGQWDSDSMSAAYSNPTYLLLSVTTVTMTNALLGAYGASLYVELRNWKDGPATAELERVFS